MKKFIKFSKINSGFTIIETLVAITILMISIAGPLTVANKGLSSAFFARDQMIASYLAQDAMEYIKNVRDNNKLNGRSWLAGIYDGTTNCGGTSQPQNSACRVDTLYGDPSNPSGLGISPCVNAACSHLFLANSGAVNGYTHQNVGILGTAFYRNFYVTDVQSPQNGEVKVSVVVQWKTNNITNSVVLEDELFDTQR